MFFLASLRNSAMLKQRSIPLATQGFLKLMKVVSTQRSRPRRRRGRGSLRPSRAGSAAPCRRRWAGYPRRTPRPVEAIGRGETSARSRGSRTPRTSRLPPPSGAPRSHSAIHARTRNARCLRLSLAWQFSQARSSRPASDASYRGSLVSSTPALQEGAHFSSQTHFGAPGQGAAQQEAPPCARPECLPCVCHIIARGARTVAHEQRGTPGGQSLGVL